MLSSLFFLFEARHLLLFHPLLIDFSIFTPTYPPTVRNISKEARVNHAIPPSRLAVFSQDGEGVRGEPSAAAGRAPQLPGSLPLAPHGRGIKAIGS